MTAAPPSTPESPPPCAQPSEERTIDEAQPSDRALLAAYRAALAVADETDLETVLRRLVELARGVVSARYGALGVAGPDGRLLRFIHSGIDAETAALIGPLPEGRGLLGVLIHEGESLLMPRIADDPRSVGFPPNHPPMTSLLGVPIMLDGEPVGNLYLSERVDGLPFTPDDLSAIQLLATHAASAIQRARLHEEVRRAREQAERQRDRLQVIIDQLPAGVAIQEPPDGTVRMLNRAAIAMLFGPNATIALPLPADALRFARIDGGELPAGEWPHALVQTDMKRGGIRRERQQQLLLRGTAAGRDIPVFVQSTSIPLADDGERGCVVAFQDVTALREAEQLKDDFLSLLSHEFRTPLTAIHGGAHMLEAEWGRLDPTTEQELLADIARESNRLDQLLSNMLRLAEVLAGRLQPATEPVLLGPVVHRVVRAFQARGDDRAPEITVEIPRGLPALESDPLLLDQVLRNLIENAIKYSGPAERPAIAIIAEEHDGCIDVHVRDSGIGISPEHVGEIFERFRRPGADTGIRGMGLGLYLCRHLIVAQGGRIWAESEGLGMGTTISIALPVATGWTDDEAI
ncbi:MAG: ATP-binding protein [Thermomicrobiales bacterium]